MTHIYNKDLNDSLIRGSFNDTDHMLRDHSYDFDDISVYFREIEGEVIRHIKKADVVFGCVAWLTNFKIINALSVPKYGASIVVQKEDFLKPDLYHSSGWQLKLREKYDNVQFSLNRTEFPEPICNMSICSDPTIDGIRCVGNCNSNRNPSFPRMHNKFLVFATVDHRCIDGEYAYFDSNCDYHCVDRYKADIHPYAIWTGSLNFSISSTLSFENAVVIRRKEIAELYFKEFCQILALSETLDWSSEWMEPEWYIGT